MGKIEWTEQLGAQQVLGVLMRDAQRGAPLVAGTAQVVRFESAQVVIRTIDHWVAHVWVEPLYNTDMAAFARTSNYALESVSSLLRQYGFEVRLGQPVTYVPAKDPVPPPPPVG